MHFSAPPTTLAIFCKVVDNYGDIGICWRLARQLRDEHGIVVSLWVDALDSFRRLCPAVDPGAAVQHIDGVAVHHWRGQDAQFTPDDVADIVIEFFACDIAPAYIEAMAQRRPRPVWLNLEGLTAEDWVEGCHTLPSMHPRLPLTKHFFFPGFSAKTGGLMHEAGLDAARQAFQADAAAQAAFLDGLGLTAAEQAGFKVSLFCYPHAPVAALLESWEQGAEALTCLVPEGVAVAAVEAFLGGAAVAGAARRRGALSLRVLPFLPQPDYDRLLWACDCNLVRGEDSFVRAQWAGRPFVWHIYPQDENLHHKKLRAFLQRYAAELPGLTRFSLCWNDAPAGAAGDAPDWPALWTGLRAEMAQIGVRAAGWQQAMLAHGDLTGNLLQFAAAQRALGSQVAV